MFLTIVAILLLSGIIVSSEPANFTNLQGLYFVSFYRNMGTLKNAEQKCWDMQSGLLTIETIHELADITCMLDPLGDSGNEFFRLGGYYNREAGIWMWSRGFPVDDGLSLWCDGYPKSLDFRPNYDDRVETSLVLSSRGYGKWCMINEDPKLNLPFICERNSEIANPIPVYTHPKNYTPALDEYPTPLPWTTMYPTHWSPRQPVRIYRFKSQGYNNKVDKVDVNHNYKQINSVGSMFGDLENFFAPLKNLF